MKKKVEIAFNRVFNFILLVGCAFCLVAYAFISENDVKVGIVLAVIGLLCIACDLVFVPWIYTFDEDGVSLNYLFLPKERYLWDRIYEISLIHEYSGTNSSIFDLILVYYLLQGNMEGKCYFYMSGKITKTMRTTRLLRKYWDGHVEGFLDIFLDGGHKIKNKIDKIRKKKKYKPKKKYLADEVIALEKSLCTKVKEQLKFLEAQAKQLELEINTKYLYVTKNGEQFKKRPDKGYTYMLLAEISNPGETDQNRIVEVSVDLVYVRLGRNAYRGVENEFVNEELNTYMTDVLDEIRKNRMEAFYE